MNFEKLIDDIKKQLENQNFIEFSAEHLAAIRLDQVQAMNSMGGL